MFESMLIIVIHSWLLGNIQNLKFQILSLSLSATREACQFCLWESLSRGLGKEADVGRS